MDWKRLLEQLNEAGWSQARIAERCRSSQAAVSDLQRGATKDPRFGLGSRLLALHGEVLGEGAASAQPAAADTPPPSAQAEPPAHAVGG
jgi:transcriptional regulator with XRE-family HTH domain